MGEKSKRLRHGAGVRDLWQKPRVWGEGSAQENCCVSAGQRRKKPGGSGCSGKNVSLKGLMVPAEMRRQVPKSKGRRAGQRGRRSAEDAGLSVFFKA